MTLRVVVTEDPDTYGPESKHKCVRPEDLKHMEYFKEMVKTFEWEKIYEVCSSNPLVI